MSKTLARRVTAFVGLMIVAGLGFVGARGLSTGSSVKAGQISAATPGPGQQVCGKDLAPDRSVIRSYCIPGTPPAEFWYIPLQKADEAKPRFDGTINGIRLGPNIEPGAEFCASAQALEASPSYLPPETSLEWTKEGGCESVEKQYTVLADVPGNRFGGPLNIFRFSGRPQMTLDAPVQRVSP